MLEREREMHQRFMKHASEIALRSQEGGKSYCKVPVFRVDKGVPSDVVAKHMLKVRSSTSLTYNTSMPEVFPTIMD